MYTLGLERYFKVNNRGWGGILVGKDERSIRGCYGCHKVEVKEVRDTNFMMDEHFSCTSLVRH